MSLNAVAEKYHAFVSGDGAGFQRKARILQSMWREEQGYPAAPYKEGVLGSRLPLPWAKDTLANFLTDNIRDVVKSDVLDGAGGDGRLIRQNRLFGNLLSSQPLCYNLFGELTYDLELASRMVSRLTSGRFAEVTDIRFEYSPGRSDPRYSGDKSAFDVYLQCKTPTGNPAFLGIEVKYHEDLKQDEDTYRPRYDEVADQMGCFKPSHRTQLLASPLQQVWRDHLLCGALKLADNYADAAFVFLYPKGNRHCEEAVAQYAQCLHDSGSFMPWMLEDVVEALRHESAADWINRLYDRYLNFDLIEEVLNGK